MEKNTESTLLEIISTIAEVPVTNVDASLVDELDVDSFKSAEIAFEIERRFNVKLNDAAYAAARTPSDILKLLAA